MKEGNNIEKLFKDGFDNYEVDPGDHLWSKIQNDIPTEGIADAALKGAGSATNAGASWLTTVVVGGAIGLVSVAGYYYYFENKAEARKTQNESEQLIEQQSDQDSQNVEPGDEKASSQTEAQVESIDENANFEDAESSRSVEESSSTTDNIKEASPKETTKPVTGKSEIKDPDQAVSEQNSNLSSKQAADKTAETSPNEESAKSTDSNAPLPEGAISNSNTGSDLESTTNTEESSQADSDTEINTDVDVPAKQTNENKGANSSGGSIVSPPSSNSVDETPGVIEAYKPPNIFTPNGDGSNDVFRVDLEEIEFDKIEVQIFDRTGDLVHNWQGEYGYWDGKTNNGSNAPEGPYIFTLIITKDGKVYEKKGVVTLTRGQ